MQNFKNKLEKKKNEILGKNQVKDEPFWDNGSFPTEMGSITFFQT